MWCTSYLFNVITSENVKMIYGLSWFVYLVLSKQPAEYWLPLNGMSIQVTARACMGP